MARWTGGRTGGWARGWARGRGAAGLALVLAATVACSAGDASEPDEFGYRGSTISSPYQVPALPTLTDTTGESFSLADSTDKPVTIVFFGYTNCPDICKLVMANIASGLTRLGDKERQQVEVVFVTTDPARDDGPTLRKYLDRYGDGIIGLTGPLASLTKLGEAFHVFMKQEKRLPSGGYEVSHTTHYFAVTEENEVPLTWSQDTAPADFAADVSTLLKEES